MLSVVYAHHGGINRKFQTRIAFCNLELNKSSWFVTYVELLKSRKSTSITDVSSITKADSEKTICRQFKDDTYWTDRYSVNIMPTIKEVCHSYFFYLIFIPFTFTQFLIFYAGKALFFVTKELMRICW